VIDYHSHSVYSDGKSTYKENLNQAVKKGLKEFGFSDHLCIHYPDWGIRKKDIGNIIHEITEIKNSNQFPINIKFGLEVDYIEDREEETKQMIDLFPLDYVIGSIHYVGEWNFDTKSSDYKSKNIDKFYAEYFRLLKKAAKSGLFDIMGHIDVVKKFNYLPSYNLKEIYKETASVFYESDIVIEVNSSGKDKPCKEFYPSDDFLRICFEKNVPVTLGSDAHHALDIGRYFPEVIQKLKNMGYNKLASFENRKRSFINF